MYNEETQEIEVSVGEVFEVQFMENPTTGYQWKIVNCGKLELLLDSYTCTDTRKPPAPGSGGVHRWQFKADSDETLTMVYKRAWENISPLQKTITIKVKVK